MENSLCKNNFADELNCITITYDVSRNLWKKVYMSYLINYTKFLFIGQISIKFNSN